MTMLLNIIEKIQETHQALARMETLAAENPDLKGLDLNIRSLYDRSEELQNQFSKLVTEQYLDVCSYRLISEPGAKFNISALSKTLGDFQYLFSSIYDAIKNGPKQKAQYSAEVAQESSFEFGYTYAGSLGFVFTMPNERLLIGESNLDLAMQTIFQIAKSKDSESISTYARQLGPAPIRLIYKWANDNLVSGFNVDIRWKRGEKERASALMQIPEFDNLTKAIAQTSDETEETVTLFGRLVGGDIKARTFHMEFETGDDIRGGMHKSFKPETDLNLGEHYTAKVIKRTKIHYSTEQEDTAYFLILLDKSSRLPGT
jgi:hypothetical protein